MVRPSDRNWGRSGRVLAVTGFALLMATLTVVNVQDAGVLADLMLGDVITVVSSAAFVLLAGGLALRDRRWAEFGFLLASLTYMLRASFILLTEGPSEMGVWLSLGAATAASGLFLTEAWAAQSVRLGRA